MTPAMLAWEPLLGDDAGLATERCRVPGGWLVRCHAAATLGATSVALAFVPDRDGRWLDADWERHDD